MAEAVIQFEKLDDILNDNTLLAIDFEHVDEIGDPISLLNTTVRCQFRRGNKVGKEVVDLTLGSGLTLSGAGNNVITIDENIIDWGADTYFYDIQITFTATGNIHTYIEGTMKVLQNTTRNG